MHDPFADTELTTDRWARTLRPVLVRRTSTSSSGYPYLEQEAWERFRDTVPHTLSAGTEVLAALERIDAALGPANQGGAEGDEATNLRRSMKVVGQVTRTAAITAPPDLWLLRQVLATFAELGLAERLLRGEAIYPEACEVDGAPLDPTELVSDLHFLLSRGFVEQYEESFRIAGHPVVRRVFESIGPVPVEPDVTLLWARLLRGEPLSESEQESLLTVSMSTPASAPKPRATHWVPELEALEVGYRLVPVVLGLRESGHLEEAPAAGDAFVLEGTAHPLVAAGALEVLHRAGWLARRGERYGVTAVGARGLARGPGPFGIIQTYHPYLERGAELLREGRGGAGVWVRRGENVAASQDANRSTFRRANDALDRFCGDLGFELEVFIEHAIGRGEATRQRFERSGDALAYVGADLEDDAIDAAVAEQRAGRLPQSMRFVRNADIGSPASLLEALREHGLSAEGSVMVVGNGFHEVRDQTDESMVRVFARYEAAGVLLLFTEENALSIDDLRATAWNTYHAGFKYVHDKSGQGLRPAEPRAPVRLGVPLRAAWSECALAAGYVRATGYCGRTRTVYPYTPPSGRNPAISVSHFFVPRRIAARLGLA